MSNIIKDVYTVPKITHRAHRKITTLTDNPQELKIIQCGDGER